MAKQNTPGEILEAKVRSGSAETTLLDKTSLESQVSSTFTDQVLEFCAQEGTSSEYSVIMFDVDYFKAINDLLSHQHGDEILAELVYLLEEYAKTDEMIGVLGKKGGEEFLIALPYVGSRVASYIADEIRQLVHDHCFDAISDDGTSLLKRVTISLGVNTIGIEEVMGKIQKGKNKASQRILREEMIKLLEGADVALSMSKYLGRDTVQVFREYLAVEKNNLDTVRNFYFRNAWSTPKKLRQLFSDRYFNGRKDVLGKMKKHFYFVRTELNPRDTRTAALLSDNTYRLVSSKNKREKEYLVKLAMRYSQRP